MRPIDADALIQFFQSSKNQKAFYTYFTTTDIIRVLDNAPTLTLDDLRSKGEWIHSDMAIRWDSKDTCSVCRFHEKEYRDMSECKYCPNCGAKNGGGK